MEKRLGSVWIASVLRYVMWIADVEARMNTFTKITIVFLSAQLFIMGLLVSQLAYKLGFEKGRVSVYQSFADSPDVGTPYVAKRMK